MEQESHKVGEEIKIGGKVNPVGAVIGLIIVIGFVWYFLGGGLKKQTTKNMDDIYQKVADDAVNQYRIAERQGDKIQICVQAMQVSAAYLQAQNESSYQNWKDIEKTVCRQAGMPQ